MLSTILRERAHGKAESRVCRVLFNVFADEDNYNAQSLNARDIALRLDPTQFCSTMFFEKTPDPRLLRPGICLVKLPEGRKTWRILREMMGSHDFIVYIDLSPASYLYLHLPRFFRRSTRTVLCIEGSRGNLSGVSATVRRYAEYLVQHADLRITISEFLAWELLDLYGLKSDFTVPVGVDTHLFLPPPERNNAPLAILFVGHLIERKGAHLVLEAARHFPQARFRMIGHARDDFGHNLKLTLRGAGLANVSIEDPVSQAQMVRIMQESDILLLPSRVEGIPKVTLEAAAAGLPCVVFDDYQTPSVVDGVTGFQVKKFEEMLVRLQLLIQDHELRRRMCAAAVAHAKSFDWDRVAAQWGDILGNLEQRVGVAEK